MTNLQEEFCRCYVENGYNGTRAYLEIKPETTEKNAANQAYKWLKKPEIQAAIRLLQKEKCAQLHITPDKINTMLDEIAQDKEVSVGDRLKALKQLSDNLGIAKTVLAGNLDTTVNIKVGVE